MKARVASVFHAFDLEPVRLAGAAALIFLLGFAAGNSHRTEAVLKGQAVYFQQHESQQVKKTVQAVRHEDAKAIGVPDKVLKGAVDQSKATPAQ